MKLFALLPILLFSFYCNPIVENEGCESDSSKKLEKNIMLLPREIENMILQKSACFQHYKQTVETDDNFEYRLSTINGGLKDSHENSFLIYKSRVDKSPQFSFNTNLKDLFKKTPESNEFFYYISGPDIEPNFFNLSPSTKVAIFNTSTTKDAASLEEVYYDITIFDPEIMKNKLYYPSLFINYAKNDENSNGLTINLFAFFKRHHYAGPSLICLTERSSQKHRFNFIIEGCAITDDMKRVALLEYSRNSFRIDLCRLKRGKLTLERKINIKKIKNERFEEDICSNALNVKSFGFNKQGTALGIYYHDSGRRGSNYYLKDDTLPPVFPPEDRFIIIPLDPAHEKMIDLLDEDAFLEHIVRD